MTASECLSQSFVFGSFADLGQGEVQQLVRVSLELECLEQRITGGACSVRSSRAEQAQPRKKKEGSRVAIRQLQNHLKRSNAAFVVTGGTLDTDGQAECVNNLLLCQEDRTVEVHQWITEVPYDAILRVGDSVSGRQAGS